MRAEQAAAAAAAAGRFPEHPGSVSPLQLEDLLPDGKQTSQLKEAYVKDEQHGWSYCQHPEAAAAQLDRFRQMLAGQKAAFAYSMAELPGYTGGKVRIELVHDKPIITPWRRYSRLEEAIQQEKCEELQQAGLIEPADPLNRYASAATMPAKKDEHGQWVERRYCIDMRAVNAATKPLVGFTPHLPEVLFQKVEGCRFFSTLDLRSGFHQLLLDNDSKKMCAFWWGRSLWQYNRLIYGLRNATAEFQKVMDTVLGEAGLDHCAWAYVDDVLIASPDMETHIKDVQAVLAALHAVGLRVHPGKSVFCADAMALPGESCMRLQA